MQTDERYEVVDKEHGEGGFGKVSIQRDKILERLVAVKSLLLFEDEASRERFVREAKTLARMSHPNVPAIYDVRFSDESMRLYFEFVEGETLAQIISGGVYPSMDQARRWFIQVAFALDHAHSMGIVHRDVKPENIIISPDRMSAYLVDFGIAFTADDVKRITASGYVIGTLGYMSPEQMEGRELDGKSDIYSLGITLYEALCGHLPQIGEYKNLSDANEAIPPGVDDIIKQCLAQDRQFRLPSAREFITALRNVFRSDIPFSALLTEGRLHELHAALQSMSAEEFSGKPKGQKLLVINRVKDLIRIDDPQLRRPTAEMIELLLRLALYEAQQEYESIVSSAFEWGFTKFYTQTWSGDEDIRNALIVASKNAPREGLLTISKALLEFTKPQKLEEKPGWYLHDLRLIVMAILANQYCDEYASELAELYNKINTISHSPLNDPNAKAA